MFNRKKIPKKMSFDKEALYDQAINYKMQANSIKDENHKLKAHCRRLDVSASVPSPAQKELAEKERMLEDLIITQQQAPLSQTTQNLKKNQEVLSTRA